MAKSSRVDRVAELVQQEVSKLFTRGMKDPRIGLVTITGVKMTADLREAWVYYSVLGDDAVRAETAKGLAAATGFVKRELSQTLNLRSTPDLHFKFDESVERGDRIERLLREVKQQDAGRTLAEAEGIEGEPGDDESP